MLNLPLKSDVLMNLDLQKFAGKLKAHLHDQYQRPTLH